MSINPYHSLVVFMILAMFVIGLGIFITGVVVLIRRAASNDLQGISEQAAKLAQKGIAEDVAGLVGNAANLMEAMNQLTRTTRGVGIILVVFGSALVAGSCFFAYYIYQMNILPPLG